ncbi:phytanoyl-CoA dioxygenase family protein [Granulicella sp. dw_53]|uniref:phytanoyl-CoA dioxygenase family protein n=1 Tax=Granulicella sp. dw_53 TaxID=2719792 RepID=UPI001BD65A6B|nr:phytanoyl-CoA dioxygenase family protein [Granulicella sp. dw_53]
MKSFRSILAKDVTSLYLQEEMDSRGYVLIRELLPVSHIKPLLLQILEIVQEAGWLLPDSSPLERLADLSEACGDSDPEFKTVYERIFQLELFHAFPHHPALQRIMSLLVGPRLLVHPKPIGRLIFPKCERFVIQAHQDHQSIAGDAGSFTIWMPLHDCPIEVGPLQVLENSHRFGLQSNNPATGIIAKETAQGDDWVSGQINAGDVLIFHDLTVHAATPNTSDQIRISMDCRFQDYTRALNPANLVFPGSTGRSWEAIYSHWHSDDLKYFWQKLPLTLKPSLGELNVLAETAEASRMRPRYAKILSQLQSQISLVKISHENSEVTVGGPTQTD